MDGNDNYTLKEMLSGVISDNREFSKTQAVIVAELKAINLHLETLNSKVATNVTKINNLENAHIVVKAYVAAVSFFIGLGWTAVNFIIK